MENVCAEKNKLLVTCRSGHVGDVSNPQFLTLPCDQVHLDPSRLVLKQSNGGVVYAVFAHNIFMLQILFLCQWQVVNVITLAPFMKSANHEDGVTLCGELLPIYKVFDYHQVLIRYYYSLEPKQCTGRFHQASSSESVHITDPHKLYTLTTIKGKPPSGYYESSSMSLAEAVF